MRDIQTRRFWECGPLILDAQKSLAFVDEQNLALSEDEFGMLYLLVQREGKFLTDEVLYKAIWEPQDERDCREAARQSMEGLVKKLRDAGKGAVWIEVHSNKGFTVRQSNAVSL